MSQDPESWRGGRWTGLIWERELVALPHPVSGRLGYDGYRSSYFAILFVPSEDDDDPELLLPALYVGTDGVGEIPVFRDFKIACSQWHKFPYPGAIDWGAEPGLEEAVTAASWEAIRRYPDQPWYRHMAGHIEVWSRIFQLNELGGDWGADEAGLYEQGYRLGKHFSTRTAPEGELGHIERLRVLDWHPVYEQDALEALSRLGIPLQAAEPP